METLEEAYKLTKRSNGSSGIDGVTYDWIEAQGLEAYLQELREELIRQSYRPQKNKMVEIPKAGKGTRTLKIPCIRDRVVQGALKLIIEPIFEADFQEGSYGYRPKRQAHEAIKKVERAILQGKSKVIDLDLKGFFDQVRHHKLMEKIAKRIQDKAIMSLIKKNRPCAKGLA